MRVNSNTKEFKAKEDEEDLTIEKKRHVIG